MIRRAARRYAEAAFELATAANAQDAWARDLERLATLLNVPEAEKALGSPAVPARQKLAVIDAEVPDLQLTVRNVVQLLLQRDRLDLLPDVSLAFRALLNASRRVV